jgi:hypothetical protein
MIAKAAARARRRQPMEVILTVKFNFGDHPHEAMTLVDERRVPLVGSIFDNRDRIAREFLRLLVRAGARQPGRLLGRGRKRGA